ncbi:hypothetical protein CQW23_01651 [Capsicum baccatum]|uniref:AP2/ERF domain-containing protein n=1 Tax=Capsicum baccatum TaxID=33114 RepID=A0A2G2XP77_CAPBA|nr:hypothetical protein CQW23_01651 [Capsicum baccatum]
MKLTTDEEGKAKPPKERSQRYMKRHVKRNPLLKNENTEVISIENSLERNLKLPQEKLKKYKGVGQRKQGKWMAEVRVLRTKDRIWIGTFNTVEEVALAYDKTINEIKGAYTVTNILKPPPRYPSPTEINYMNPPSSSIDNARI